MSDEQNNQNGEKKKKIEALEKMFGPKETKKSPAEDNTKDKVSLADALKAKAPPEKQEEPEKELNTSASVPEVEDKPEVKKDVKANINAPKSFPLEKLKENLNPELKDTLKKISNTVPKESINKLLNTMESNKDIVFDKGATNVFANLDPVEANILSKKMAEWELPPEASEVNASVIMAWMNKTKK